MQVTPCYPCLYFTALEKSNCPLFWLFFIKYKCLQIHQGIRSEINSVLLKLLTCGSWLLQGASLNISYFTCRDCLFGSLISETGYGIFSLIFLESKEFKRAWWKSPDSVGPEEGSLCLYRVCVQLSAAPDEHVAPGCCSVAPWTPEQLRVLFHPDGLNPHPPSATGAVHSSIIGLQSRQTFSSHTSTEMFVRDRFPVNSCLYPLWAVLQVIWSL